jgi:hypothetical protein
MNRLMNRWSYVVWLAVFLGTATPRHAKAGPPSVDEGEVRLTAWLGEYGKCLRSLFAASANELAGGYDSAGHSASRTPELASESEARREARRYDPRLRSCLVCTLLASEAKVAPEITARELALASLELQGFVVQEGDRLWNRLPPSGGLTIRRAQARACSACRSPVEIELKKLMLSVDTSAYFNALGPPDTWPKAEASQPASDVGPGSLKSACQNLRKGMPALARPPTECEAWETCIRDFMNAPIGTEPVGTDPRRATARAVAQAAARTSSAPASAPSDSRDEGARASSGDLPPAGGPTLTEMATRACSAEWNTARH